MQQRQAHPVCSSAETILDFLTVRQFVRPHRQVADVMNELHEKLGACDVAIDRALGWLQLSPATAVGRLRRTELMQLSRSIHRFWRAALISSAVQSADQPLEV